MLHRLVLLAAAADGASISAAARSLRLAKSTVSEGIAALEAELGATLLVRRGRGVAPTPVGEALAVHARAMLGEARSAVAAAREAEAPRGTLRISTPAGIADPLLLPMLADFLKAHPGIALEVVATDSILDLQEEGLDLAFRIGGAADGRFVARRLVQGVDIFVAAPAYLDAAGPVRRPPDLAAHPFLGFAAFGRHPTYAVTGPEGVTEVAVACRLLTTSGATLRDWAVAGAGLARLPLFLAAEELARGRLRRVLPEHEAGRPTLHAVVLPGRYRPANAGRLLAHAVTWFAGERRS